MGSGRPPDRRRRERLSQRAGGGPLDRPRVDPLLPPGIGGQVPPGARTSMTRGVPEGAIPAEALHPARRRAFQRRVLAWYRRFRRDLPWRRTTDPYHILVSEVMLQQTPVARVIPKYRGGSAGTRLLRLSPA